MIARLPFTTSEAMPRVPKTSSRSRWRRPCSSMLFHQIEEHVRALTMMNSLTALFARDELHIILGPDSHSPKLDAVSLATTASEIRAMQAVTDPGHLAKDLILMGDAEIVGR